MFKRLMTAGLVLGMAATAPPALAANCAPRDKVIEKLSSKYSESLAAGGLQQTRDAQTIMEIWTSVKNETFTVLLTNPNGISCIVGAGTDFFEVEQPMIVEATAS